MKKYGARNQLRGKITSIQKGDVMSLIKVEVSNPAEMGSVITTESLEELGVTEGDEIRLIVKAIHVLPVKE
jgi:molybdopterin-binding protein